MRFFLTGLLVIFLIIGISKVIKNKAAGKSSGKPVPETQPESAGSQQNMPAYQGTADARTVTDNNSIVDLTPAGADGQPVSVPYWGYRYILSYSEIFQATNEQRQFYFYFRDRFAAGEYPDLKGNINYAFILMFELLDKSNIHRNIAELEKQLKLLGQYYPQIKPFANTYLIRKLKEWGDNERAEKVKEEEYNRWKLGGRYKDRLNLSREEIRNLNQLHYTSNKFNNIDMCMLKIIKLYCAVINELKNRYAAEGTTLDAEVAYVAGLLGLSRAVYGTDWAANMIYTHIFKYCENAIRELCGCAKTGMHTGYPVNVQKIYEEKIFSKVTQTVSELIKNEPPPDMKKLCVYFPQLRSKYLQELKKNYSNGKQFFDEVTELNKNNSESLFYSATAFMMKHDMETAVKLYLCYLKACAVNHQILTERRLYSLVINRNLNEATRTVKKKYPVIAQIFELNARIVKLFKNEEQSGAFKKILTKLIWSKDLNGVLNDVPEIFRKKIRIDSRSVAEIQRQHAESVTLLNEYLKDDAEDENVNVNGDAGKTVDKTVENTPSVNTGDIEFSQIQSAALSLFTGNGFSVSHSDMETFAKSNGVMKNQLVESINELCYESLDDILIEENDEYYTIDPRYYQKIQAK